jgi:hypothetical protein
MTKISQYSTDVNITGNDKWIGSDAQNFLITKNFTPNNLANYFNGNNVIDIGTSIRYIYQTLDPGEAREQGTISFETEIGPQVNFSAITTFLIAKNSLKQNDVSQYLDFLIDSKILLSRANNINIFGYYKITSLQPWIPNTNFFVVTVDFLDGNGFISEDLDYLVSLVDKVQDVPPPVWGSITGDIQDQTDLINYISSQVTTPTLSEVLAEGNTTGGENIVINDADAIQLENSSTLKKGTYDFGADGGISRICGVGFEDMWQAGIRHVFDSNGLIRNSTNGFNIIPNATFDNTLRFKVDSLWTLDNGTTYKCTDATTGAAVWKLVNTGTTPTLQEVLTEGGRPLKDITGFSSYDLIEEDKTFTLAYDTVNTINLNEGVFVDGDEIEIINIRGVNTELFNNNNVNEFYYNGSLVPFGSSVTIPVGSKAILKQLGGITGTFSLNIITENITAPTLQEVTDALLVDGYAESTNPIIVGSILGSGGAFLSTEFTGIAVLSGGFSQGYGVDNNGFRIDNSDGVTQFSSFIQQPIGTPTASYVWNLPDASGTLALTSDLTTPTLQEVTAEGNESTNPIIVGSILSGGAAFLSAEFTGIAVLSGGFSQGYGVDNNGFRIDNSDGVTQFISFIKQPIGTPTASYVWELPNASGTLALTSDVGVTSVGLTMPSAFIVTNSPINSSGDIAVTGAGLVSQYVRGDGTLANFPSSTGGGSSVNYYLNGSVSQGTFGGTTYYQMSKTPILGAGTNFTRTNGAGNGYIASFITDAGDPSQLNIPGGNWNVEFYFNASSGGGSPSFYAELYKVSAANVFTLIASDSLNPEGITNGTTVDQYFTSIPVPQTTLLVTDRLAVRIFVNTGGRTITLHTENSNLSEVLTTFTTGLTALNGLTDQVQFFDVGTGATNFNISSSGDTHTFNLLFNIRRNANNSSNNNINYNGYAVTGSAESSAVWTITRLTIAASGSITVATATNVAWTDRETTIYT